MLFLSDYILFLFMYYVCMYVWLCWVFVSVRGLSLVAASRGHSSSRCVGLSPSWPLVAKHRLQTRRPSNCGSWAKPLRGMWDPPRPGLEPASPALAGKLSTTAPPGKPSSVLLSRVYRLRNWGTESLHRLLTVSPLEKVGARIQIQVCLTPKILLLITKLQSPYHSHCFSIYI